MNNALVMPTMRRLRISSTLSGYIVRQFLFWFLSFLSGLAGIIFLVTLIDLLDRLASKEASLAVILPMALLKLPHLMQEVMPFTVLFASMTTFWRLTRSHELVVTRAAGISIWQFLLPVLTMGMLVGAITITMLNPLSSVLLSRFEQLEASFINRTPSSLAVSRSGLWLRQADDKGQSVIHAARVAQDSMTLHQVIIFRFAGEDRFLTRIDASRAELLEGRWHLFGAVVSEPGAASRAVGQIDLPTGLTPDKIQDSFAPPETISFWSLPEFIDLLEGAGFSSVRHKLQLHRLLAIPVLFSAMILLAATFSLRPQRRGHVGLIILAGVLTGFLLYFISNFVFALGLSSRIPVILAAWTPAGISMLLGIAMLLHLEDG